MKSYVSSVVGCIAIVAAGGVLACEYSPMKDAAAFPPANASQKPAVLVGAATQTLPVQAKALATPKGAKDADKVKPVALKGDGSDRT